MNSDERFVCREAVCHEGRRHRPCLYPLYRRRIAYFCPMGRKTWGGQVNWSVNSCIPGARLRDICDLQGSGQWKRSGIFAPAKRSLFNVGGYPDYSAAPGGIAISNKTQKIILEMFRPSFYSKKYCWRINSQTFILTWRAENFQAVCLYKKTLLKNSQSSDYVNKRKICIPMLCCRETSCGQFSLLCFK